MLQRDPAKRASLSEIESHPWLQGVDPSPAGYTAAPLTSHHSLLPEEHEFILQAMTSGSIADRDAIQEWVSLYSSKILYFGHRIRLIKQIHFCVIELWRLTDIITSQRPTTCWESDSFEKSKSSQVSLLNKDMHCKSQYSLTYFGSF